MYSVGDIFPDFDLPSCDADNNLGTTTIPDDDDRWSVFYFYPKDFTFICPTEIRDMDKLVDEDCNVLGFSGDNEFCKLNWKENNDLIKNIRHTLVADTGLRLSTELGIVYVNYYASLENVHSAYSFLSTSSSGFEAETWHGSDIAHTVGQRDGSAA